MLTDKREILHIKSYFSKHANEEIILEIIEYCIAIFNSAVGKNFLNMQKYSLQGTTQGRYLTGGVPPVRFSM